MNFSGQLNTGRKMRGLWLVLSLLTASACYSQDSGFRNWYAYFGTQKISERLVFHNEAQHRNHNFIGDLQQLLLRTGLGYDLTPNNNNLLLGYGFIQTKPYVYEDNKTSFDEHRIFQQFIHRHRIGRTSFQHRFRLEERFIEQDFSARFRYFLGLNIAINDPENAKHVIYLSLYDEIFLTPNNSVFDRNRLYGALGWHFSQHLRCELGVVRQTIGEDSYNHLIVSLFNAIPFRK